MKDLTARDVMNRQVLTVSPEMSVHELALFLTENQISGAPVIDDRGKLVGVASLTDIAENDSLRSDAGREESAGAETVHGWEGKASRQELRSLRITETDLLVRDIMTPAAYTVGEDTPVPQLAQTMIAGRIHRLLVTREHAVIGIVTSLDLVKLLCEPPLAGPDAGHGRTVVVR